MEVEKPRSLSWDAVVLAGKIGSVWIGVRCFVRHFGSNCKAL
jgi:hypothetical protein